MFGVAMPSRTYNFLAAGKPVLALTDANSEVVRVIEEDQVGWHLPPRDAEKLLDTIYNIYEQRAAIGEMGKRARKSALEKYSVEVAINKFQKALKK